MKTVLKILGVVVGLVVVGGGAFFGWAKMEIASKLDRTPEAHTVGFPMPYPLSEGELAALRADKAAEAKAAEATDAPAEAGTAQPTADGGLPDAPATAEAEAEAEAPAEEDALEGVDLGAIAKRRALKRGEHLVTARYACIECHGKDFSGGVMVDDPAIGKLLGPNITQGSGSRAIGFTPEDWDRIVRHGIKKDGHPGMMPSEDFQLMSDQELSDVVVYILDQPPVDNEVPSVSLGPLGTVLAATGKLPIAYDMIHDHDAPHAKRPPRAKADATFGKHLAGICTGCHRAGLEGGPIAAGPPDWPPARNLTPHADGTEGWTYEQFEAAMRKGVRPDGSQLKLPMTLIIPYAQKMTDTEMQALWAYISSTPATPTGE